ncbi:elongation factor P [Fibrobacterota bacterium]
MGTVATNEFRKRLRIMIDGEPYVIVDNEFVKPGKGQAFNRVKIKNLLTGKVIDRTYKSGTTVEEADMTFKSMQYLFNDGSLWTFMDPKTYDQIEVSKDVMEGVGQWLLDNTDCELAFWESKPISVTPPIFMNLEVTYTEPAVKGNTSTNVMKDATLETGAQVKVPLFIDQGMKVKIDTRTGEYVERAKE